MSSTFKGAFINNEWTGGVAEHNVNNPSDGSVCGSVSDCGADDAHNALNAALDASSGWGSMSIADREKCIQKYADNLKAHKKEIMALLVAETGKLNGNADYDFQMLIDCLQYHVEEVKRCYGAVFPSPDNSTLSYTRNVPVGVVVAVLTWNFPLLNLGYKLGPILATGCTCVIKPSEMTPLATSLCVSLVEGTGIPKGVINLVNGTGLSLIEPLCSSTIPRLLTTIGSTVMGKRMIKLGATSIKRFSLELGGDAPVIVTADADLEAAVGDICGLKFANGGQICVSPNRVLVERSVYEKFLELAVANAKTYTLGSGDADKDGGNVLQPVVSEPSLKRLLNLVTDAQEQGARCLVGGDRGDCVGYFLNPTILADMTDAMKCQSEEIFGPILAVRPFDTVDEAIKIANNSEYGLSAYVYTKSLDTMLRAENEIMCGNVCINGVHYSIELPHGGLKQSGNGKDISHLSLRDYYDTRRISVKR